MNTVVKKIVSSSLFKRRVAGFSKQHMDSAMEELRSRQCYAETEKLDKTTVPLTSTSFSSDATKKCRSTLKRYGLKHRSCKSKKCSSKRYNYQNDQKRAILTAKRRDRLCVKNQSRTEAIENQDRHRQHHFMCQSTVINAGTQRIENCFQM